MIENNYIKRIIVDLKQCVVNEGFIIIEIEFELDEEERINQEVRNYWCMFLVDFINFVFKVMFCFKYCFVIFIYSYFFFNIIMIMFNVGI